jgi:hypothetical protein
MTKGFQVGSVVAVVLIIKVKGASLRNTEIEKVIYPWNVHIIKIEYQLKFRTEK